MNFKMAGVVLAASIAAIPAHADLMAGTTTSMTPSTMTTNTTTIAASTVISPGRYSATISPSINSGMSDLLAKTVGKVQGIKSVSTNVDASTVHFTVTKGSHVLVSDIEKAVAKADDGAVVSTPILEHSMSPNPGL